MSNKVYIVGVGMTKFEKPGRRVGWDYPDMARESGTNALQDAGIDYREVEQGYVGYVYGESTSGQRALYELGMTGIPDRQRQQQLLDRFHRAVPRRPSDPRRIGRLHHCAGVRKDEARIALDGVRRPDAADGQAHQGDGRDRRVGLSGGALDVRGRRARAHAAIRHHRRAFRQDRLQEPHALSQQPVCAIPGGVHPRRHPGVADDLRPAHQAAVLADLRRFGRGNPGLRGVRRQPRAGWPSGGDRRAGDDHRLHVDLRRQRQESHRLRHERSSGATGLRPIRPRARRISG